MFQQILKLSNSSIGKKDANPSQPVEIKRKKRKPPTDGILFIGKEESSSKSKRMKIVPVQVKNQNGKGRPKKAAKASDWPDLNKFPVTHHASPKIWDMFERFQNFAQRRVLKRHPSGLLDSSVDESTTHSNLQSNNEPDNGGKNSSRRSSEQNCDQQSSVPFSVNDENGSSIGGDRKRRCVEISDYEDDLHLAGKREPQPASAFKPKCLNFDNIYDS